MAITFINEKQLDAMVLGAGVLGSGGGGNPRYDYSIAKQMIRRYGSVRLIQLDELCDSDFVMPLCFMGAPLVAMEKVPSGTELKAMLAKTEEIYGRKVTALVPTEIGGGNAFAPFLIAGELGLPVVDADDIGRAFPELQMCASFLADRDYGPSVIADQNGDAVTIICKDPKQIEAIARAVTVSMGSVAAEMIHAYSGDVARNVLVPGSVTRAIQIGSVILGARGDRIDPVAPLVKELGGKVLMRGSITDINHIITGGFLRGTVTVQGEQRGEVRYQNEYLIARLDGEIAATTPDIIMLLEQDSAEPLTTDVIAYGFRVALVALPSPAIWTSEKGLALVGPRAFGFDTDYVPCGSNK